MLADDYDVFVSYSHAADGRLAPVLQRGLERVARGWYQRRALHVFRDQTSLSATPSLWSTIEAALGRSRFFVLLASPEAACSPWVAQEVSWWREHRSLDTLLIVVTDGRVTWNAAAGDFDWDATNALPRVLRGGFEDEPLWVDLGWARSATDVSMRDARFRERVATLAAPIRGVPRDRLISEDVRYRRRAFRLAVAAVMAVLLFAVAASIGAFVAIDQRNEARDQRDTAQATLLANRALAELDDDPSRSLALAIQAYDARHIDLSEAVLRLAASHATPQLVLRGHGVAVTPDGRYIASSSEDKTVRVWDWRRPHAQPTILTGHSTWVLTNAFTPDGRYIATAGSSTVRVWDWRRPRTPPAILRGHTGGIRAVAFSPDGRHLAIGGDDETVRVWDWRRPRTPPTILRGHGKGSSAVAFTPDGRHLATADNWATVRVWDWRRPRRPPTTLYARLDKGSTRRPHTGGISAVAFTPDGRHVAAGSDDWRVRVWDWRRPRIPPTILRGHTGDIRAVAFTADGQHLASASSDETVRVWDWRRPRVRPEILRGHAEWVTSVAFTPDGRHLVSSSGDETVRVWDWRATLTLRSVLRHQPALTSLATHGAHFAEVGGRTVRVWNLRYPRTPPTILRGHRDVVTDVWFTPDGRRLLTTSEDRTLRVWNWRHPRTPPSILRGYTPSSVLRSSTGEDIAVGADGGLASAGDDGTVRVWDWRSPRTGPATLPGHTGGVEEMAFTPDGRHLAIASQDRTVRVWDWRSPRTPTAALRGHAGEVEVMTFAPDGRHLAVASHEDQTLRVWDWRNARTPTATLRDQRDGFEQLEFTPDGRHLATVGSGERTVRVWDWRHPRTPVASHTSPYTSPVSAMTFAPDGRHLAVGGFAGSVRLWDWRAPGVPATILRGHAQFVSYVAFTPDGHHLISIASGIDRTVRVWDCQRCGHIRDVLKLARSRTPRELAAHVPHRPS